MHARHTDRQFDVQLEELRRRLIVMGGRVEAMISDSVRAFVQRDVALAKAFATPGPHLIAAHVPAR